MNEALEHALVLDGLIDGNTEDELGKTLAPIRDFLRKIGSEDCVSIKLDTDDLPSCGSFKEVAVIHIHSDRGDHAEFHHKFFVSARFMERPCVKIATHTNGGTVEKRVTGLKRKKI